MKVTKGVKVYVSQAHLLCGQSYTNIDRHLDTCPALEHIKKDLFSEINAMFKIVIFSLLLMFGLLGIVVAELVKLY